MWMNDTLRTIIAWMADPLPSSLFSVACFVGILILLRKDSKAGETAPVSEKMDTTRNIEKVSDDKPENLRAGLETKNAEKIDPHSIPIDLFGIQRAQRQLARGLQNMPVVIRGVEIRKIAERYISKMEADKFLFPLRGLLVSGVDTLKDENELDDLCDVIRACKYEDPFPEWSGWSKIPHGNRLEFLKRANKDGESLDNAKSAMLYYESLITAATKAKADKAKTDREAKVSKVLLACADAMRRGASSIRALQIAKADELDSNDEVLQVCDTLVKYNHPHPFQIALDIFPKEKWSEVLKSARMQSTNLHYDTDLIHFLNVNFADICQTKQPSSTPDKSGSSQKPTS